MRTKLSFALLGLVLCSQIVAASEVNLYSYRQEELIKPFLDRFSAQTGIKVNLVTGSADALLTRLQSEGQNSPADLLLTVDAGRLFRAKQAGVLQAIESSVLNRAIPAELRDKDGQWFGLSRRARVIVYSKDRVKPADLPSYDDLTDSKWKGRICVRSSDNIYNQSLLAARVARYGEKAAEAWARGVVANFTRAPQGNDRAQVKAVAAGECDLAIVNTYYLGKMQTSSNAAEKSAADAVKMHYPDQNGAGTHVNVSGAGVTRHAKNRANAIKLLEFLVTDAEQANYASENYEFPVKTKIAVSPLINSWGKYPFKADNTPMNQLGEFNAAAVKIFDRVGWK